MNAAIFAFTQRGLDTARRIREELEGRGDQAALYVPEKFAATDCASITGGLTAFAGTLFDRDALIFVGACGIAMRAIAPHVASKVSDPAVLCVDEAVRFVIPILSGHIGGANRLARFLARALKATPVITTATDVNGRFSVDDWAAKRGMSLSDMGVAKAISARILTNDIPICGDVPLPETLPTGLTPGETGDLGICVSIHRRKPFEQTLLVAPKALAVGIGCRRGASAAQIEAAVRAVFEAQDLNLAAVSEAASIDVKADEEGLLEFSEAQDWPMRFYTAEQLNQVRGSRAASDFVRATVGVDNVCERAALAGGGRLIVPKTARNGVTVAVAEREWRVEFGED